MDEENYTKAVNGMTWSFSRISSFDDCPYCWYMKYILHLEKNELFFANFGTLMHKLIEAYYKEGKKPTQLCDRYICEFSEVVSEPAPSEKVFASYFQTGLQYLKDIKPLPYTMVAVEKRVRFTVGDKKLIGFIDFLGEDDGELYIVDHKSRNLKPRSKRKTPTKTDEELDEYLRQLYLYAVAIEQEYGKLPKALCFNCFREGMLIVEPFDKGAYEDTKQWFLNKVQEIADERDFNPDMDFFKCKYLCEMRDQCEFFSMNNGK